MAASGTLAIGGAELSLVLILLCVVVVPVAAIAFARSGKGLAEIGKGRFAVDFDESGEGEAAEEVRQLVEAKAFRQARRGERPVDVETEVERLLSRGGEGATGGVAEEAPPRDPEREQMREEVRQVVVAKNEARLRRGEPPLDVEAEIDRFLAEIE